jgi:hypothetical protein
MARNMTARNDTGQADLYYFASRYFHDELLADIPDTDRQLGKRLIESQEDALEYCLVRFVLWHSADEPFIDSFSLEQSSRDNFYHWGGLRYFLMNYESKLQPNKTISIDRILLGRKEGKSLDYLSVEHLWATENRNQQGENNRNIDDFEKRRLGNFVLLELRLNIQGRNDGLDQKIPRYLNGFDDEQSTDLAQVRKMAKDAKEIMAKSDNETRRKNYFFRFYRDLNTLQEKRYVEFAAIRWSIKQFLGYKQLIKGAMIADADEVDRV